MIWRSWLDGLQPGLISLTSARQVNGLLCSAKPFQRGLLSCSEEIPTPPQMAIRSCCLDWHLNGGSIVRRARLHNKWSVIIIMERKIIQQADLSPRRLNNGQQELQASQSAILKKASHFLWLIGYQSCRLFRPIGLEPDKRVRENRLDDEPFSRLIMAVIIVIIVIGAPPNGETRTRPA